MMRFRKTLTFTLLTAGFGALWLGLAQPASAGEGRTHVCGKAEVLVVETGTCVRVDDDLLDDLGDTLDELLDDVGDAVDDLL